MRRVKLFEQFILEAARLRGRDSWEKGIRDEMNFDGDSYTDDVDGGYIEVEYNGNTGFNVTIYNEDDKEVGSESFDADGMGSGEIKSAIANIVGNYEDELSGEDEDEEDKKVFNDTTGIDWGKALKAGADEQALNKYCGDYLLNLFLMDRIKIEVKAYEEGLKQAKKLKNEDFLEEMQNGVKYRTPNIKYTKEQFDEAKKYLDKVGITKDLLNMPEVKDYIKYAPKLVKIEGEYWPARVQWRLESTDQYRQSLDPFSSELANAPAYKIYQKIRDEREQISEKAEELRGLAMNKIEKALGVQ